MAGAASTLVVGTVFGLALAAPPGPMNAVIAEESVFRGWVAGFLAGLGAMTADACFLVLAYLGLVGVVAQRPTLRAAMVGVGGLLMLYFAYGAVAGAASFDGGEAGPEAGDARGRGFFKALVLALTNPYQILFWLTVGVGLLQPGTVDVLSYLPAVGESLAGALVVRTGSTLLVLGLFLGIGIWVVGFPAALVSAGRRVDRLAPAVAYVSGAVLAGFGLWFLVDAVGVRPFDLGRHGRVVPAPRPSRYRFERGDPNW